MADRNLRLQIILEGLDRVTAPLKSITGASSAARRDLAETHKQLKGLDALQQQVGRYKATETRYANDARQYKELQAKLAALGQQLEETEEPTKKLRNEFEKVERQTAQVARKLESGGAELQQLSSKLSDAGIDVADLARHEDRLAERTQDATEALRRQTAQLEKVDRARRNSEKLSDIGSRATGMGVGMIAAGTAAGAPIAMATKQAMTLESAMADVRKVVDFPTPRAFARMSDDILEMSTRIPMSAEGIAQIVAAAGRANVPRQELLRFAEDAAKMGVAFDSTAEEAGSTMAKWRTAFELPQQGVVALADQINALTNSYGGNVGAVTDMVTRIGPLGKVGGLAASQIAAMSQVLSSVGVESEVGATGIKNMMLALTKGEAATRSQSKAFQALGLDAVQVAKDMQRDAGGTIIDVMKRLQQLPKEAQAGALTQLFGSESVSAIAPMLTSLDQLQKNFALVGDKSQYAGSMNREYLNAVATTAGSTQLAGNAIDALSTKMGDQMLPTVSEVSEKVKETANGMRDWAEENPNLAKGIMIFMAVGSGLLILLGGLALAFAALTFAAAPLGIALGPLLLIVAAVAAVAAAAYLIYSNWGAISAWFSDLWATIKSAAGTAIDWLVDAFMNFSPIGLLMKAFDAVLTYLQGLDLKEIGRNLIQGLVNGITGMLGTLKTTVMNAAGSVARWFKEKLGIHSPSRVFAGLGGFVMAGLDQGLADNSAGPLRRISALSDAMAAGITANPIAPLVRSAQPEGGGILSRIADSSGRMAGALVAGAAAPAVAMASPATAPADTRAAPSVPGATYNITVHAGAAPAQDIAEEVRKAIEQIERERRGRGFGDE
ncbi:phage tail tape measure protein [Novosphingobium sp. PP1Y]|uniref:phage tail tape measure protein n=1 Tax=Novosphingobium sp. PP1Y TaxID=702113 RepID=UPI00020EE7C7|nr:phage tail tape measure protein [Novosphingobium sp. PP1Y]CCA91305.1 putative phage-related membrane protein [Novosphingobium sp. PP1Y]